MNDDQIRRARPDDAEAIAAHNVAMAAETEALALDPGQTLRGVRQLLAEPERGFYVLAERDGVLLGQTMITFEWSDWRAADFWWIQSVYVRPEARRQGVFRALYEHLRDEARRQPGVCGIKLYVFEGNRRARRTYAALGMPESRYVMHELEWGE